MRPRKLHIAGALILFAWVASLGALVKREYFSAGRAGRATRSALVSPGSYFYSAFVDSRHAGFASITVDTVGRDIRIAERQEVHLPSGGGTRTIRWALDTSLDAALGLRAWHATLEGEGEVTEVLGSVESDGTARLTLVVAGDTVRELTKHLGDAVPLTAALLRLATSRSLALVSDVSLTLLDPLDGSTSVLPLRLNDGIPFHVVDSARFAAAARRWEPALTDTIPSIVAFADRDRTAMHLIFDRQGRTLRWRDANGVEFRRTAFEIAQLNFRQGELDSAPSRRMIGRWLEPMPRVPGDTSATLFFPAHDSLVVSEAERLVAGATSFSDTVAAVLLGAGQAPESRADALDAMRRSVAGARALGIPARLVGGAVWHGSWAPTFWIELWHGEWRPAADFVETRDESGTIIRRRLAASAGFRYQYEPLLFLLPPRP